MEPYDFQCDRDGRHGQYELRARTWSSLTMKGTSQFGVWRSLNRYTATVLLSFAILNACGQDTGQAPLDGDVYQPQATRLAGSLHIATSNTLAYLMRHWLADFQRHHPALGITLETGTTSQAAHALAIGAVDLATMTRTMTAEEERRFEQTYGYQPVGEPACMDAVMVVVHADNPLSGLTLPQLKAIFSGSEPGSAQPIERWGEVNATGEWAAAPIHRYALASATATAQFFSEAVLQDIPWRQDMAVMADSADLVSAIVLDRFGIGFASIGYLRAGVRAVALAPSPEVPFVFPSERTVQSKTYPLSRVLYVYTKEPPATSIAELLAYMKSKDGQRAVREAHFYPLRAHDHRTSSGGSVE